ncbi:MAG: DNA/RNA non-specific endonuclease [Clostridium sp.]|nr:DNA/RNA non-specific endonuclease [Clostridium sp.]
MARKKHIRTSSVPVRYRLLLLAALVLLSAIVTICSGDDHSKYRNAERTASNAVYGDLLDVVTPASVPQSVVQYRGMDISFNPSLHIPNWVAWELTRSETTGDVRRSNKFQTDATVPGCASTDDYRNSGYDRGHMAPAGDMKWNQQAMEETFYMTNICPQDKALNTGAWKKLEEKCRQWADRDSAIVIVCGPVLTDSLTETIGSGGVAVPKRFFKVVLSPYTVPARGIGFLMPNERVEGGMQRCVVPIDEVERLTGLDFFHELPDSIETIVEAQCNFNDWN